MIYLAYAICFCALLGAGVYLIHDGSPWWAALMIFGALCSSVKSITDKKE